MQTKGEEQEQRQQQQLHRAGNDCAPAKRPAAVRGQGCYRRAGCAARHRQRGLLECLAGSPLLVNT